MSTPLLRPYGLNIFPILTTGSATAGRVCVENLKNSHSGIHFKNSYYKIENCLEETGARFENDQRKELDPCSNPVCSYQYLEECLKSIMATSFKP